ncbi:VanZ family protein [Bacillaceae bacterium IKA-2]|nr:VanZ family protein [Bacillaceae bacterium IKA-2]
MRQVILLTAVIALLIIGMNTVVEMADTRMDEPSFRAIYKQDASILFFLDRNSSFYDFYSFKEELPSLTTRKISHFLAYGFLASIIFLIIPIDRLFLKGLLAFGSASLIGLIDEVHQHFIINRSGRILDVYINTAGSLVSVLLLMLLSVLVKVSAFFFIKNINRKKKTA